MDLTTPPFFGTLGDRNKKQTMTSWKLSASNSSRIPTQMHTEFDMPFNNANKNVLFLSHRHHYHPHFVVNTSSQQHPFVSASPPATRAKRRALQSYALKYETTVERINERKDKKISNTKQNECIRMLVPRYTTAIEPTLPKKCLRNRKSRETILGTEESWHARMLPIINTS